jgi:hypothetical protein
MKNIFLVGLIATLFMTNAFAEEGWVRVPVKGIQNTELDGLFNIQSSEQFSKVTLDCVSFIHGINFYDSDKSNNSWELSYSFPLSESQCSEVFQFIKNSLEKSKPVCVELDVVNQDYILSRKEESCRLGS